MAKNPKRFGFLKIAVIAFVVALVAVGAALFWVDHLAKMAIEMAGTRVLGVKTTVANVSIGLLSGTAGLGGLHVANPDGFAAKEFMTLEKGDVAVTTGSLLQDIVRIPSLELKAIGLDFEEHLDGSNNLQTIMANVKKFAGDGKGGSTSSGKKFVIDVLTIKDIVVVAHTNGLPLADSITGKGITIRVPLVQLKNIGSGGKDPVGMDQLLAIVLKAVLEAVNKAGAGQLPDVFMNGIEQGLASLSGVFNSEMAVDLGKGLEGISGQLGGVVKGVGGDVVKGAEDAAKKAEDTIKKGIGDVFKKKE